MKNPKIHEFIAANANGDISSLSLQYANKFPKEDWAFIIQQIESRRKAVGKFTDWAEDYDLIFPKPLSIEQSSSQATATYKASLLDDAKLGMDLTAGFGLDSYYLAQKCQHFIYNELDADLSEIVQHNYDELSINNVEFYNQDAENMLGELDLHFDFIYIDPARRGAQGNKLVSLAECQPNILNMVDGIRQKSDKLLIKTSPLLDISLAIKQLGVNYLKAIHVVSVNNECKELLFLLDFKNTTQELQYYAINIKKIETDIVLFDKIAKDSDISEPLSYLYEPNASLMKLGLWNEIAKKYGILQISKNTHLYTAEKIIADFPGRVFKIVHECKARKKEIHQLLPSKKANITTRNYSLSVKELRAKLQLSDGGDDYIFAFKDSMNKPRLFITHKI